MSRWRDYKEILFCWIILIDVLLSEYDVNGDVFASLMEPWSEHEKMPTFSS